MDIHKDAARVLDTLQTGGIAIIPISVGYAIVASAPPALRKIFDTKRRAPDKRHAMIGSYALHAAIHQPPPDRAALVHNLIEIQDLPLGVIAPYNPAHPLLHNLDKELLARSTKGDTLAMLVNGGPFQEELVRLATERGMAVFGSSANLSGRGTKVRVSDIEDEIKGIADVVVDYGVRMFGDGAVVSSTMVDFGEGKLLRRGVCHAVIVEVLAGLGLDVE